MKQKKKCSVTTEIDLQFTKKGLGLIDVQKNSSKKYF